MEDIFYPDFDMKDNDDLIDNKSVNLTNTTENNEELSVKQIVNMKILNFIKISLIFK